MALAILVAGVVVGIAFADVSVSELLSGLVVLAALTLTLFMLSRRHESDHSHDRDDHFPTVSMR